MNKLALAACAALALGVAGAAPAQETGPRPNVREACAADFQHYCGSAQTREDRRRCMAENRDKFSDPCKAALAAAHARHARQWNQNGPTPQ